ncbi:hypothetical protein V502_03249 [Pseudogymnoascus sp. VKM F-4520 (FW-2644)]|nr:hypothetical protein V502_03249 [Pseudogymnoascus sp. VKM F-4520 (FW-2644)]
MKSSHLETGSRWLPAIDYPSTKEGFWYPQTSTINWCEEDYYATIYAAEIVNTLTNLLFMYLGIKGVRSCLKHGHDKVFMVTFLGYLAVGTGSFMFHSTLKCRSMAASRRAFHDIHDMPDVLCMLLIQPKPPILPEPGWRSGSSLPLSNDIKGYYHYLQDPTFHQNAYAILTAIVVFRSMYVMEVNIRPSLRAKYGRASPNGKLGAEEAKRDKQILRDMWLMIGLGLTVFLGGFGIWSLDNHYCSTIRRWRHDIGLPWGILLEGHGWWHLMTGTGAYMSLVWGIWLRHCLNERQDEYELHWPRTLTSLPEIVRSNPEKWKGSHGTQTPTSVESKKEL